MSCGKQGGNVQSRIAELRRKLSATNETVERKSDQPTPSGVSRIAALKAKLAQQHLKPTGNEAKNDKNATQIPFKLPPPPAKSNATAAVSKPGLTAATTNNDQSLRTRGSSIEERIKKLQGASKVPIPKFFTVEAIKAMKEAKLSETNDHTTMSTSSSRSMSTSSVQGESESPPAVRLKHMSLGRPRMNSRRRRRPASSTGKSLISSSLLTDELRKMQEEAIADSTKMDSEDIDEQETMNDALPDVNDENDTCDAVKEEHDSAAEDSTKDVEVCMEDNGSCEGNVMEVDDNVSEESDSELDHERTIKKVDSTSNIENSLEDDMEYQDEYESHTGDSDWSDDE